MADAVVQLRCDVQKEGWGKKGKQSAVARLWSQTPGHGPIEEYQTYSEMRMGTWPSNTSSLLPTDESLGEYLKKNPQLIGGAIFDRWGPNVPFLSRVLSFSKALPLQIHTGPNLAQKPRQDINQVGDIMQTSKIAIALSKFELFAGIKPLEDIRALFTLRSLQQFVPSKSDFTKETLRQVCKNILNANSEEIVSVTTELQSIPDSQFGCCPYIPGLLCRLGKQSTGSDNACLMAVLMTNHFILGPGDAARIPAGSIYAYIEGDIIEFMVKSEDAVSTGLSPVPGNDDPDLVSRVLSFSPHTATDILVPRCKSDKGINGKTDVYGTAGDFNVLCSCFGASENETQKAILGPSLMIVTKGHGAMKIPGDQIVELHEGYIFFVGQGVALDLNTDKGIALYRVYAE